MPRAYKPLPSQARLKELFDYRPETGKLIWRVSRVKVRRGGEAGCVSARRYRLCGVDGIYYYSHRLIWRWMTGEDPGLVQIDHRDLNKANNCWENLRLATGTQNQYNRPKTANNRSGYKGVSFKKREGKWEAKIKEGKNRHHLGYFATPEEAHAAYAEAALRLHGDFARLG